MKAGEHGPDKLYPQHKFKVIKNSTGLEIDQDIEFVFVLRPETDDKAALAALKAYADTCAETYPNLSQEILAHVRRITREYPNGNPAARRNGMP